MKGFGFFGSALEREAFSTDEDDVNIALRVESEDGMVGLIVDPISFKNLTSFIHYNGKVVAPSERSESGTIVYRLSKGVALEVRDAENCTPILSKSANFYDLQEDLTVIDTLCEGVHYIERGVRYVGQLSLKEHSILYLQIVKRALQDLSMASEELPIDLNMINMNEFVRYIGRYESDINEAVRKNRLRVSWILRLPAHNGVSVISMTR